MIITVGRQHGSNGHDIARLLAQELNMKCYDKEIVDEAAANSHFSKEIFDSYDEKRVSAYVIPTPHYVGMNEGFRLNMQVAAAQFDAMRNLADKGNCIFVGRCADFVLRDTDARLLRVFASAPFETRIQRKMDQEQLSHSRAVRLVRRMDRQRSKYREHYTGLSWNDPAGWDLMLDTSVLSIEQAAEEVAARYLAL